MTQFDHQVHSIGPEVTGSRIFKFIAFLYGIAAYLVFFVTILYAIGFVMGLVVPKTIDTGTDTPPGAFFGYSRIDQPATRKPRPGAPRGLHS